MPDALPIPADLADLQRSYDEADAAVQRFVAEVDAGIGRADFADIDEIARTPGPEEPPVQHPWTDQQHEELDQLRSIRLDAVMAMHRHPTMVQAREQGCYQQTMRARQASARISPEA